MATATKCRQRKVYAFSELPKKGKARAIERFLEKQTYPDWDDVDFITEWMEEVLQEEFGIEVTQQTYRGLTGKTHSEPNITWDSCPVSVEFEPASVSIEDLIVHGKEGEAHFSETAAQLAEAWNAARVLNIFAFNHDPDWTFDMKEGTADFSLYDETDESAVVLMEYRRLADRIGECLKSIYKNAVWRLERLFERDIDYHYSEDYAAEYLSGSDEEYTRDGEEA